MQTGPWRPDEIGRGETAEGSGRSRARRLQPRALETPADRQRLWLRARVLEVAVVMLAAALLLGFWRLQILRGEEYSRLADDNQLRPMRLRAARGLILDRHGELLASNHPSYEVALTREDVADVDAVLRWLAETLDTPVEVLQRRLDAQRDQPAFRPAVVASNVPQQQVVAIETRKREHPGVTVQVTAQRYYPSGTLAAHVLGHVGEISARQLEAAPERFRMGDVIGQNGVESMYNDDLVGDAGSRLAVVNSVGREIRILQEDAPASGMNLVLTLDAGLQREAERLLEGRRGAIVAIDVATGGILALANSPSFDPNAFAARFSAQDWAALIADPARPLQNRALAASLPPGSTFKLAMAIAGLEEQVITTDSTFFCPGGKTFYGRFFRCLGQHGSVNVVQAITVSCNSFFYELGVKLGRERIVRWAERLGMGNATGIDLPEEQRGIIPSDAWLESQRLRFYAGETVSIAIGQGRLAVSPLQLAHMASIIGSGFVRAPHLLMRVEQPRPQRQTARTYAPTTQPAAFSEGTRQAVLAGMRNSVASGTSARARLADMDVGGKTGTAQVASAENVAADNADRPEFLRNHAWFVGLAPIDDPQIAVAVFIEHGGSGGSAAAPVGGALFSAWRHGTDFQDLTGGAPAAAPGGGR